MKSVAKDYGIGNHGINGGLTGEMSKRPEIKGVYACPYSNYYRNGEKDELWCLKVAIDKSSYVV